MLKIAGFVFMIVAFIIAVSGYFFLSGYDLSDSSTSVIDASLMQIAHLRYMIAAIFATASAICFASEQITSAIDKGGK